MRAALVDVLVMSHIYSSKIQVTTKVRHRQVKQNTYTCEVQCIRTFCSDIACLYGIGVGRDILEAHIVINSELVLMSVHVTEPTNEN